MSKPPNRRADRIQKFGSRDTARKQGVVVSYLAAYLRVMSKQRFHLSYVDAFAGCGARIDAAAPIVAQASLLSDASASHPKVGTALEALRLRPGFQRCVFGDRNGRHLAALEARIREARASGEVLPVTDVVKADANVLVRRECAWIAGNSERKAVMFLDPYGMQVEWRTLQAIADCPGIDLWLLLPTGIAVNRLLPWKRAQHPRWAERMDAFYGSGDWRSSLLTTDTDMLGMQRETRSSDFNGIVRFTMDRLGSLFGGGLLPQALPLRVGCNDNAYHLVFANSSKSEHVRKIAHDIAGHLICKAQAGS